MSSPTTFPHPRPPELSKRLGDTAMRKTTSLCRNADDLSRSTFDAIIARWPLSMGCEHGRELTWLAGREGRNTDSATEAELYGCRGIEVGAACTRTAEYAQVHVCASKKKVSSIREPQAQSPFALREHHVPKSKVIVCLRRLGRTASGLWRSAGTARIAVPGHLVIC